MAKKLKEGIELLRPKQDPISIQEITLMDWYVGFALMNISNETSDALAASMAFDRAEAVLKERAIRIGD